MKWVELLAEAIQIVLRLVRNGATDDEIAEAIAEHLASPATVGQDLLDAAERRRAKLARIRGGAG